MKNKRKTEINLKRLRLKPLKPLPKVKVRKR